MVAHLGCLAITLSHNFWEPIATCTKHGETHHRQTRFASRKHNPAQRTRHRALKSSMPKFAREFGSIHSILESAFDLNRRLRARRTRHWIQTPTFDILNTCRSGHDFRQETGAHFYAQAHISTQPASSLENAWLPLTNEDKTGSSRTEPPSCVRPQACLRKRWLPRLSIPRRFVSAGAGLESSILLAGILPVLP